MDNPRYCSNCGTQIRSTANFCPSCGRAVSKSPDPAPAISDPPVDNPQVIVNQAPPPVHAPTPQPVLQIHAPASVVEKVVGIIPGAIRHSGFLGVKTESFIVVLTDMRIIFAAQTGLMMQENVRRARDDAKQDGKGFFGQWGAQFKANSGQQYREMPPQEILAEQPTNFYISKDQLHSVRVWESSGGDDSVSTYYMEFRTPGGKHKFTFGHLNVRDLKKQLQQIYGNIVR